MRISDWSSDVCSSDLYARRPSRKFVSASTREYAWAAYLRTWVDREIGRASCRERVWSVRVDLGGRRIIKQNNTQESRWNTQKRSQTLHSPNVTGERNNTRTQHEIHVKIKHHKL